MNRLGSLLLLLLSCIMQTQAQVSFGKAERLNDGWLFLRADSAWNIFETPDMKNADYDDRRWRRVTLPHDWGVELPMSPDKGSCQGYLPGGTGWYRKSLPQPLQRRGDVPTTPQESSHAAQAQQGMGTRTFVYFEGVYNYSEVYLNGHLLGKRPSGFASFLYDMTPYLHADGENILAVRVNHSQEADSRWYTGSGIYRNVWLITAPEVHLAQWGTAYRLTSMNDRKATLEVDIETTDERLQDSGSRPQTTDFRPQTSESGLQTSDIKPQTSDDRLQTTDFRPQTSDHRLQTSDFRPQTSDNRLQDSDYKQRVLVELKDADGKVVASTTTTIGTQEKKTVRLSVAKPRRWTLENPYLYTLTTRLQNGDESVVKAGLRTLEFSPDKGFALNGQWMKVKGVCVHDDAGALGTAVPAEVWRRRIQELKAIGVNAIRMSHNPHAPELYDICDEEGMLVMDEASDEWEFPKRKWLKGWNQGRPGFEGTYTYFEEWIDRDVADMVRRDRCHPSIFLWSIGNEVDYPNDPYSHPVLDGDGTGFTQPMYGGYKPEQPNAERIGRIAWRLARIVKDIDPSRPTTGALAGVVMSNETAYPEAVDVVGYNYTESRYDSDHAKYPQRVIYGSENRHDLDAWKAVRDKEHIFGQFLWTGIDYLGESGTWPARGSSAGLLDLAGQRKPNGWYRASLWSELPVCYIGSLPQPLRRRGDSAPGQAQRRSANRVSPYAADNWNFTEGQRVRIVCYTNGKDARLTLNGQPLDAKFQRDEQTGILYTDIDYHPGTLRCEADNGAAYELKTSGRPAALRVTYDGKMHVFVEVVDKDGNLVKTADNEVTLNVSGARLLGMENGNISDTSVNGRQMRNRLRVFGGRLVAYIDPLPGQQVSVQATSPFLE